MDGGAGGGGFLAEGVVFVVGGYCSGGVEEFADVAVGVVGELSGGEWGSWQCVLP